MIVLQLRVVTGFFFLHGSHDFVNEIVHGLRSIVTLAANAGGKLVRIAECVDFVQAGLDTRNAHADGHFVRGVDECNDFIA